MRGLMSNSLEIRMAAVEALKWVFCCRYYEMTDKYYTHTYAVEDFYVMIDILIEEMANDRDEHNLFVVLDEAYQTYNFAHTITGERSKLLTNILNKTIIMSEFPYPDYIKAKVLQLIGRLIQKM